MNLLVTGGAGFIGTNFVNRLMRGDRHKVIVLDKLTYAGRLANLDAWKGNPKFVFVHGDIADRALSDDLLKRHKITAVVNFAAESHVDRSISGPADFIHTNLLGTFSLLESARGYCDALSKTDRAAFRFLHVSTDEVYGSLGPQDPPFSEASPYSPNSPYSASKAGGDHLVRAYSHTYGLPTLTTNCSNNYGPYQFPEKLIPLMITNALQGKPIPVYGDGLNVRDWLYVEDHCRAVELVLLKGRVGETYNIGGLCEQQNIRVVEAVCALLDKLVPDSPHKPHKNLIEYVQDRRGHDRRYAIDCRKITAELNWKPEESLESGLQKTVKWYLDHPEWPG